MPTSDAAQLVIVSDRRLAAHAPSNHPERPARLDVIFAAAADLGIDVTPAGEPVADEVLLRVHPQQHLDRLGALANRGGGLSDPDTHVGPDSERVARLAVAAALRAGDAVMTGEAKAAIAAVRPPGHHALVDATMGFCLYAAPALLVRHLQHAHGVKRVAVVDFDVHHGNGTQDIFWTDGDVLAVSLHEDPRTLWPGSGFSEEAGEGDGKDATLNVPLPAGTGDADYLKAFRDLVIPKVRAFQPEVLQVAAGFDAAAVDPLAHMELTNDGFAAIGRELAALSDEVCDGRVVCTLEGGYDLDALRTGLVAFLGGLTSRP